MALTPATTSKISDWYSRNAPKGGGMLSPKPASALPPLAVPSPAYQDGDNGVMGGMLSSKADPIPVSKPVLPLAPILGEPSTRPAPPLPNPTGPVTYGPIASVPLPQVPPPPTPKLPAVSGEPVAPPKRDADTPQGMLSLNSNDKIGLAKPNLAPISSATPLPPVGTTPVTLPPVSGEPVKPPAPATPPPIPDTSSMTMEQAMAAFQATPGNPLAGFSQQQIIDGLRNVSHETFSAMTPLQRALAARVYALAGVPLPNSPLTTPQTLDPESLTTRNVTGNETVAGQMKGLLDADGEWIQSNQNKAVIEGNSRGMLNSTMSASAGRLAAINSALPIAQADAATYGKAADYNAALKNQAKMFNAEALNKFAGQQLDINANRETQIRDIASKASLSDLSNETQRMVARLQAETSTNTANISANSSLARDRASLVQGILNNPDIPMDRVQQMLDSLGYPELGRATQFREDLNPVDANGKPIPLPGLSPELSQAIGNFQSSTGMLTGYTTRQIAAGLRAVGGDTLYGLQPNAFNQAVEVYWRAGVPLPAPPAGKPAYQYPTNNPWGAFGSGITGTGSSDGASAPSGTSFRGTPTPEAAVDRWNDPVSKNKGGATRPVGGGPASPQRPPTQTPAQAAANEAKPDFNGSVDPKTGFRYHRWNGQAGGAGQSDYYNDPKFGPFWVDGNGTARQGKAPTGKTQYGAAPGTPPKPSSNPAYNQDGWVYSGAQGKADSWTDDSGRPSPVGPGGQQVPDPLAQRRAFGKYYRDAEGNAIKGIAPAGVFQWNADV